MHFTRVGFLRRFLNHPFDKLDRVPKFEKFFIRQRIFRFTSFFRSSPRDCQRLAKRENWRDLERQTKLHKANQPLNNYIARRRINAGLDEFNVDPKYFRNYLNRLNIQLSSTMLANLAAFEPRTFKSIAMLAKQMAINDGIDVVKRDPLPENVFIDNEKLLNPGSKPKD